VAGLSATIFLLGMRHGLDADHLAAIDGLARFNALSRPRLARLAGVLFSGGHGLVVVAVAAGVCAAARHWQVPAWFDALGAWISILVLALLAVVNGGSSGAGRGNDRHAGEPPAQVPGDQEDGGPPPTRVRPGPGCRA